MKKILFILLVILKSKSVLAQTENYKIAIENFVQSYNTEKYDEIFSSFSQTMKQALPREDTKQFLKDLKSKVGKISNKNFAGYNEKTYATFTTQFETMILAVNISLDDKDLINGLFIEPLQTQTEAPNKLVNLLSNFPNEISNIVFSKAKDFPNNTQISIAVIENGKTNYYGVIKLNDTLRPIQNQKAIFEIGSISKVFTSTVLASLIEEKKIQLTDNINAFYPFDFKDDIKINFLSLANHSSGLPRLPENFDVSNSENPYKSFGKTEIEFYLKNLLKIDTTSNKKYGYSNLGTGLLSYTLGLSQKTTFGNLLQKRVFFKYKMKNSFTSSKNLQNRLVKGLKANGEIASNWDFDVFIGAGGVLSTTEDLAKFAKAQFNLSNKELLLTRISTLDINKNMKIGLGWHLSKSANGNELVWHNGGTGGYSSSMALSIEEKSAVIVLSNLSAFHPKMENIEGLCFELLKEIAKR